MFSKLAARVVSRGANASLLARSSSRTIPLIQTNVWNPRSGSRASFSSGAAGNTESGKLNLLAVGASIAGAAALLLWSDQRRSGVAHADSKPAAAAAPDAALANVQATVASPGKANAAYIWIHLAPSADVKKVASIVASLDKLVDKIVPVADRDEDEELLVGVGFGPQLAKKLNLASAHDFTYETRTHPLGAMPATGGDIFVHAKSNVKSHVFDFALQLQEALPPGSVAKWEDRYGWVYRNGRDLSGFIDGTENPASQDDRVDAAVNTATGGSYLITQRWIHDLKVPATTPVKQQEEFVGRTKDNSVQLNPLPTCSHVSRMVGTDATGKKIDIVRQSMPYGSLAADAGLFFIAYANSPANFNFMLDRMVGKSGDGLHDDILRFSKCVSGNFWYVPPVSELQKLA